MAKAKQFAYKGRKVSDDTEPVRLSGGCLCNPVLASASLYAT